MPLNPSQLADISDPTDLFERVWSQMTPAECVRALQWSSLIVEPVDVPKYLTADSTLTFLHWNEGRGRFYETKPRYRYTGGMLVNNQTAADARQVLKRLFAGSPSTFLAAVVDDARARLLVRSPRLEKSARHAVTRIVFWDDKKYAEALEADSAINERRNCAPAEHVYYADKDHVINLRTLARTLAARPPGQRVVKMGSYQPLWKIWHEGRYCFFDQEFESDKRHGLSVERWFKEISASRSIWRAFWIALRRQGESLLGPGRGAELCDRLIIDAENYREFVRYKTEWIERGEGYRGNETLDEIFKDPDWPKWRERIAAAEPLSQAVWDTWDSWDINTDERVFLFDAATRGYLAGRFVDLASIAKQYFPKLQTLEYATAVCTEGTHPSDRAYFMHLKPYGVGGHAGGVAMPCYGDFNHARWYWPKRAEQTLVATGPEEHFAALLTQLTRIANLVNGSTLPRNVFLSYNELEPYGKSIGGDGFWQELILHAALVLGDNVNQPYGGIHYYQPEEMVTPAMQRRFVDLVHERDTVVGEANAAPLPMPPIDSFKQGFLTTGAVTDRRQIHRVTANPTVKTEVLHGPEGVEFKNSLASLKYPRGRLHPKSQSPLAPLGWWVESPV